MRLVPILVLVFALTASALVQALPCALVISFPGDVAMEIDTNRLTIEQVVRPPVIHPFMSGTATLLRTPISTWRLMQLYQLQSALSELPDDPDLHRRTAETMALFFRSAGLQVTPYRPSDQSEYRIRIDGVGPLPANFVRSYSLLQKFLSQYDTTLEFGTFEFGNEAATYLRDFETNTNAVILGEHPNLAGNHHPELIHELYHWLQQVGRKQKHPNAWPSHRFTLPPNYTSQSWIPFATGRSPGAQDHGQLYRKLGFLPEEAGAHLAQLRLVHQVLLAHTHVSGRIRNSDDLDFIFQTHKSLRHDLSFTVRGTDRAYDLATLAYAVYSEAIDAFSVNPSSLTQASDEHFLHLYLPSGAVISLERSFNDFETMRQIQDSLVRGRERLVSEMKLFDAWNAKVAYPYYHEIWTAMARAREKGSCNTDFEKGVSRSFADYADYYGGYRKVGNARN